jgi:hypothetical protein
MIQKLAKWVLCAGVLAGLGYSTAGLFVQPAYASDSTCEPEDCAFVEQYVAPRICSGSGGVLYVSCPLNGYPNNFFVHCADGGGGGGTCDNF